MKIFEHINMAACGSLKAKYRNRKVPAARGHLAAKASKWAAVAKLAGSFDRSVSVDRVVSATCQFFGVRESEIDQSGLTSGKRSG
jgi:hypothetical protein